MMHVALLLLLLPSLSMAGFPFILPSCMWKGTTWDQTFISNISVNIPNPEDCQATCSTPACAGFSWLTSESIIHPMSCSLFSEISENITIPCDDCISGPPKCTCSIAGECAAQEGNIVDIFHDVVGAENCENFCQQNSSCQFYTFFGSHNVFSHVCFLFSSCNDFVTECTECTTGSKSCERCSFENTQPDGSCKKDLRTGLLIAGGYNGHELTTVELFSPAPDNVKCLLPSYSQPTYFHTVDFVNDTIVSCHEDTCQIFTGTGWQKLQDTLHRRSGHSSAVINNTVMLIGGDDSQKSTEMMPLDGRKSIPSITLHHEKARHCTIKTSTDTIVITGGYPSASLTLVTEYSGLGGTVTVTEFPSLRHGRAYHACGLYKQDNRQVMIVTGGSTGSYLSSTELYDYSMGRSGTWRESTPLPSARNDLRGSNLAGVFHVAGGLTGQGDLAEILAWDPVSEAWSKVGAMTEAKGYFGITEVNLSTVIQFCANITKN